MTRSLTDWLDYQQQIHPAGIALGLDRVREVATRLGLGRPGRHVITVGGTNGKGSTVAFIEAITRASGHRVGCFTSPHLLRYNERVRIDGSDADDAALVAAFERIEAARGETPLTYFEFGTLAALLLFEAAALDLAVLEVGLGGRLDAVNIVDADVAVVTTIDLDHVEWLGPDREAIGREKAGIFRRGRPAIVGDPAPPASLLEHARQIDARLLQAGVGFACERRAGGGFRYRSGDLRLELPPPALPARCQPGNACNAIAALLALGGSLPIGPSAWSAGVAGARAGGRMQRIERDGVEYVLDVAHNPQAARQLATSLRALPPRGSTQAVFSALADKDIPHIVGALHGVVDAWRLAGLAGEVPRGLDVESLWQRVASLLGRTLHSRHPTVRDALEQAHLRAEPGDRVLVFGSFLTVAAALQWLGAPADDR